jgi:hypothetical protein
VASVSTSAAIRSRSSAAARPRSGWPPFDAAPARRELQSRLNALPGVAVPDERLAKRPNIALDDLAASLPALQEIFDWTFAQARGMTGDRG